MIDTFFPGPIFITGVMEYWSDGVMDKYRYGAMQCWSDGVTA
jgi:hypothetical protein